MLRKFLIVILVIVGGLFLLGILAYFISPKGDVGVVKIEGGIYDPMEVVKELDEYRTDDEIKAVVVRIESPGGTVSASQEIFYAIKKLAEKKPVVASLGSIAASGGYYVACGATKILADPGTITGSIGVRMEHMQIGELLRWAKIEHETLKSGRFKDIASPDRPLTSEERGLLEKMLADIHRQFKDDVAKSRNISPQAVDLIADGRIFSGEEAADKGLVDQLGGYLDAVKLAGEMAGVSGEPKAIEKYKKKHSWVERIFETTAEEFKTELFENRQSFRQPMLLYWTY